MKFLNELSISVQKRVANIHYCFVEKAGFSEKIDALANQYQLPFSLLFATDDRESGKGFGLHAVFSVDSEHLWVVISTEISAENPRYESITKTVQAAHWYERYLHDMFGIIPEGHPYLRPLVLHENFPQNVHPLRKDFRWNERPKKIEGVIPQMARVEGEGICEIPVGPIHAGIIEPGHFRFSVAGERVITIEGKLFYTHKGVEKLLEGKTVAQALPFIERVSGDMSASHALAFCQTAENIAGTLVSHHAKAIRTIVLELERITMHIHDISNIAGMGTGFSVMAAQGFRIKEQMMRCSDKIFGNRFFRGFIVPGGVLRKFTKEELERIDETTENVVKEMTALGEMALGSNSLGERLEGTGVLTQRAAEAYGAVGLPARASGVARDTRKTHPYAAYEHTLFKMVTHQDGDVYARFISRLAEIKESRRIILEQIGEARGKGDFQAEFKIKDGEALGAVESWRGEILDFVRIKNGVIERAVVRDPSFCNWALFGELTPGNIVPDFPLCNKSLNLSYSGTDL